MTDKELLELAAKAAGVYLLWHERWGCWYDHNKRNEGKDFVEWNPLTDDGDALRLAVKVLNWPHGGRAFDNAVTAMCAVGQLPKDPYAATRRAITIAAVTLTCIKPSESPIRADMSEQPAIAKLGYLDWLHTQYDEIEKTIKDMQERKQSIYTEIELQTNPKSRTIPE